MEDAVGSYSDKWDWEIRQYQIGKRNFVSRYGHSMQEIAEKAELVELFIEKSPKWVGGEIYRGLYGDKNLVAKFKRYFVKGKVFGMEGTSSWSANENIARLYSEKHQGEKNKFGNEITEKILFVKKNEKTNGTSIRYLSHSPNEHEILMSWKSQFKIYDMNTDKDGTIIFYLEEL